jgi:hypothetical protein
VAVVSTLDDERSYSDASTHTVHARPTVTAATFAQKIAHGIEQRVPGVNTLRWEFLKYRAARE